MSDSKGKTGPQDASKISLSEDCQVQYWTKTLGVSREQLEQAVESTGNDADAVRAHLQRGAHWGGAAAGPA